MKIPVTEQMKSWPVTIFYWTSGGVWSSGMLHDVGL